MAVRHFTKTAWTLALAFGACAAVATPPPVPAPPHPEPGSFSAFVEDGHTGFRHRPLALATFDMVMVTARIRGLTALSPEELGRLAEDAHLANFYYAGARPDAHREVYEELVRRGAATPRHGVDLFQALLAARRWDEARAFAAAHPELPLETLPAVVDTLDGARGPAYLRLDASGETLYRETGAFDQGRWLVVVSHPGCGFSSRAMAALAADPALDQALPAQRLFLAPTFGGLKLDLIQPWNASQPAFQHVLVDQPADWPFVEGWGTPTFLFLVDGRVVDTVTGWPEEGRVDALLAAAAKTR